MSTAEKIISTIQLKGKVLTPFVIQSGDFYSPMDYLIHDQQFHFLSFDKIIEAIGPEVDLDLLLHPDFSISQILSDFNLQYSSFLRESIPYHGPDRDQPIKQVGKFIQTLRGHYIPGSSIKGAFRSILARFLLDPSRLDRYLEKQYQSFSRRPPRKYQVQTMANAVDQGLFGIDPNHDFLRMLKFSDSTPFPPETKIITNGVSIGSSFKESFTEAFSKKTPFSLSVTFLPSMVENLAQRDRNSKSNPLYQYFSPFSSAKDLFQSLFKINNQALLAYVTTEQEYYSNHHYEIADSFYSSLKAKLEEWQLLTVAQTKHTFMQIGWGTGWRSKTYDHHLTQNRTFDDLRQIYTNRSLYRPPPFPKTRKLAFNDLPFGWVRIGL